MTFVFIIVVWSCFNEIFFFQAEDGIRDGHVTGVQTCALPISRSQPAVERGQRGSLVALEVCARVADVDARSEARRVGIECRSRWSPEHDKKKKTYSTNGMSVT